ncbi:HU family DNA-binding protein, partial [Listeria monocytogenes]|uniref:HU family DNA-binding protein n=1 Tax=Listeria monocytogenes TaxID=1639 RepID=UPI0037BE7FA8
MKPVAKQASLTEAQTNEAVKALTDVITAALAKGEKVQLPGLFTAETVERPARNGRNPRTGESMTIPAHKAVKISASSTLKNAVADCATPPSCWLSTCWAPCFPAPAPPSPFSRSHPLPHDRP